MAKVGVGVLVALFCLIGLGWCLLALKFVWLLATAD
jgi:TM2 domain-containing membrane protein YozV